MGTILCIFVVLGPCAHGEDDLDTQIKAVQSGRKQARLHAFEELRYLGSRARPALGAVLPCLRDPDAEIREAAADVLADIGPGPEAIAALVEAMRDKETGRDASRALVAVGPAAIPALTRALLDSDAEVRSNAVHALGEFGPTAKDSVPALMALFVRESPEGRVAIANAWAEMGRGAGSAVPLLVELLRDPSAEVCVAAARALWSIERRPERVVPALMAMVESQGKTEEAAGRGPSERELPIAAPSARAVYLLGRIGPEARQAVPVLMSALEAPDGALCACAIEALGEIGPEARQAIPAIVQRLGDQREAGAVVEPHRWTYAGTWEVSMNAWLALGKMGPEAALGVIPALDHRDQAVRERAALALKQLGPDAVPAMDALIKALGDRKEAVRRYAACALGSIGPAAQPALPALLTAMKDPSSGVREEAADALPRMAPESPAVVAALIEALEDSDATVQAHAVMSLGKLGAGARPAVPLIARLLSSDREYLTDGHPVLSMQLADCVASVLGELGPVAKEAVPALVEAAGSTNRTNWQIIPAIGKIGPEAKAAMPFLLREGSPDAALAIAQIDPDHPEVLPILRRVWQSPEILQSGQELYPDRSWCYVLGRFGPRARPAIPTLEKLLETPDWRRRMSTALAVLEIDPTHERALGACVAALKQRSKGFPEVGPVTMGDFLESDLEQRLDRLMVTLGPRARTFVPTLCETLRNPGHDARISAAERLAAIGPAAEGAVPALIEALGNRNRVVSLDEDLPGKAAVALARIGPAAIPPLVKALTHEDDLIRGGAGDALGRIGPDADCAVPAIVEALEDERMIVRATAARALGTMGPRAAPAAPALAVALRDQYSLVRRHAAEALGAIGDAAQPAAGAISAASHDEYLAVRQAAQAALRRISGQRVPPQ